MMRKKWKKLFIVTLIVTLSAGEISTYAGPMREPNCVVPLIQQKEKHYCGAASALQAIYGFGKEDMVAGSTTDDKQDKLAENMEMTSAGAIVYKISDELNKYIDDNKYSYIKGVDIGSLDNFKSMVSNSLFNDRPVILHALTDSLDYYEGNRYKHYIVVDTYYATALASGPEGFMRLRDCNYISDYYGTHQVDAAQVYGSINVVDEDNNPRYLIYAP